MAVDQAKLDLEKAHYEYLICLDSKKQWGVKYLYDRLNIIDAKTSALLRVNSTIIGFLGAIVVLIPKVQPGQLPCKNAFLVAAIAIIGILAVSDILSLSIFQLKLDHVKDGNFEEYRDKFFRITQERQGTLNTVICLSRLGELGFVLLFVALASTELGTPTSGASQPSATPTATSGSPRPSAALTP